MKAQVLQENLSHALTITSRFVSQRAQLPVLGNILISADKSKLLIMGTNLETSICLLVGAKIEEAGDITVPAKTITELVANMTPGALVLIGEKETLKLTNAELSSAIAGMNSNDFPPVPKALGSDSKTTLPKEDILNCLSKVLFSVSTDETRPILTGVLLVFAKDEITFVSTDGYRLSKKKLMFKGQNKETKIILPKNTAAELTRLSGEANELAIGLNEKDNQVLFGSENWVLTSRILEGEFPDFEKIIPKSHVYKLSLDRQDFLRSVKLASVFARDAANIVKLAVSHDALTVFAESPHSGNQKTKIDAKVENHGGAGEFEIAFNYRYLEEVLGTLSGEEVGVEFSKVDEPGVFRDPKDPDFLHIIMPVSIQA